MNFPTLYAKDKLNRIRQWNISTEGSKICIVHGVKDGAQQIDHMVAHGKNQGKSNATTDAQQADLEAQSRWEHQITKHGYRTDVKLLDGLPFTPMLAHKFGESKKPVTYPVYIQRKYDGMRCIAEGDTLLTRTRTPIHHMHHITRWTSELCARFKCRLDGELYCFGDVDFEDIVSKLRKGAGSAAPDHPEQIQYVVYDLIPLEDNPDQLQRLALLCELGLALKAMHCTDLVVAETYTARTLEEVKQYWGQFTHEGFEGAIIRKPHGLYINDRSHDLLKFKYMQDAEFEIVDIVEGEGRETGLAIYVCKLGDDTFTARPRGSFAARAEVLANKQAYIGKQLTVQFFSYTKYGKPRFPVAKTIRSEYE